jgi:hypothetical protein
MERAAREPFPRFIKPLVPKQFRARVYPGPPELEEEFRGLTADTAVLSAEVVDIQAEARSVVLDQQSDG